MIKFIIGLIALIFVALAAYVYTGQKGEEITKSAVTHEVVKEDVQKKEIEVTKVAKVEIDNKKVLSTVESSKSIKKKISEIDETETSTSIGRGEQDSVADFSKIGEGLTLEGIKNADVSEHEKDLMLDDLAAYQSYRNRNNLGISKEEGIKTLIKEFN
jgi:hypothetical protein